MSNQRINDHNLEEQSGSDQVTKSYMRKFGNQIVVGTLAFGLVTGGVYGLHKLHRGTPSNLDNVNAAEIAKLDMMKKAGSDERWSDLARNPKTSAVTLDWMARNVDGNFVLTKSIIAGREDILHKTLEYLGRPQESTTVKLQVVYNQKVATLDDLSLLSKDSSILIRNAVKEELEKREKN